MKFTQSLIILLLIISCSQQSEQVPTTLISGKIINPKSELVRFRFDETDLYDTLDTDGAFSVELELEKPEQIMFGHGGERTYLYVRPGDQLSFSLDTELFDETLTFSGDGAASNNYMAAMFLMKDSLMSQQEVFSLPEKEFVQVVDSLRDTEASYLETMNVTDPVFVDRVKTGLKWQTASRKMDYENWHKSILKLDSFTVSEGFYAFEDELDINDTSLLDIPAFRSYLNGLTQKSAMEAYERSGGTDASVYYTAQGDAIFEKIEAAPIQEELIYDLLSTSFTYLKDSARTRFIASWKALQPDPDRVEKIDEMDQQWKRLAPGKPAPSFTYGSIEGDTMSLEDFRGQVVYIDVWATWCRPCIAEHPAMAELQKRFKDQPVAFIVVGTDESPDPWKKMIEKKDLGGIHLYAPGAWQATIMEDYMIRGIPRFILIDQEGKIVDSNAARPSGNIGEQIAGLLKST